MEQARLTCGRTRQLVRSFLYCQEHRQTTPTQGSIWFDSSDQRLKFQSSGGPVTLTTGAAAISALSGDVTASGNGTVAATVAFVGGSTAANVNAATVLANASTDSNTVSTIVRRDGAGGFFCWKRVDFCDAISRWYDELR
jgi:hypothetical protein